MSGAADAAKRAAQAIAKAVAGGGIAAAIVRAPDGGGDLAWQALDVTVADMEDLAILLLEALETEAAIRAATCEACAELAARSRAALAATAPEDAEPLAMVH